MFTLDQWNDLKTRWATNEGKPYKGQLISVEGYWPGDLSCMCAQGQVLHVLGGISPADLTDMLPTQADQATARLLNISKTHAVLLRNVNDTQEGAPLSVFDDLESLLGPQWSKLLDFWWHYDQLGDPPHYMLADSDEHRHPAHLNDAGLEAFKASPTAKDHLIMAVWEMSPLGAAYEIVASQPGFFLNLFGFKSLDDIPPRPQNYGPEGIAS